MDASVEDMEESGEAHGTTFNYKIYRILFLEAQVYYMDEYFVKDYRNHWRVLWNICSKTILYLLLRTIICFVLSYNLAVKYMYRVLIISLFNKLHCVAI